MPAGRSALDPEPWADRVDWAKLAVFALAAAVVFFVGLGIWAIGEGKVPCDDQPPSRHGSAACYPPEGSETTVDWLVRPDPGP